MKKVLVVLSVVAVVAAAATSFAQFGSIGGASKAAEKAAKGDVSGAASTAVNTAVDAENNECKGKINPYHRNVEYNKKNGGPDRINSAFGPCKVSNNSEHHWAATCPYKKFNYVNASCNDTNCSLYCYKK